MEDIAEQFERRDRFRRNMHERQTPEERLADSDRLQKHASYLLQLSPEDYRDWLARNFRQRARDNR